jgi:PKD repeat protein
VEVVRREVDQRGQVTREETIGEETEELPPPAPEPEAPRGLFGRRRKAESPPEDEPAPPAELAPPGEERPKRRRRGWILIPVLIILALLLLAVVLPALGVDPLGVGDRLGVGGGNPPEARFTLSGNVAAVGQLVTFDASGSRDPAGGALEYAWDFGDGSGASSARATHAYTARSTQEGYTVTLTVRAAGGKEAQHTEHVVVVPPPQARIAIQVAGAAVSAPYQTLAGQELAFDGGGSTAEGGVRTYSWSFGDGAPTQTGAHVTHTYTRVGGFRATLTVADTNGLLGNTSALVYVGEGRVVASQAPASVDGAKSVNETLAVFAGGGAAPYRPQSLTVTLAYNATTPAPPLPLPLPGGVNPDELTVRVYDATGAVVGQGIGPGAVVQVTDFGAVGAWTIEVFRPQGGAQALPYELGIELRNGPA